LRFLNANGYMAKAQRQRPSKLPYVSSGQLQIVGFESPFSQHLSPDNRWVILAQKIPWDTIVHAYQRLMGNSATGAGGINPRVALGAIIIKHTCDLSDRETILQIQENVYMQYFIGYSSFSKEEPFDASLFVELRKRLGADEINSINEKILRIFEGGQIGREPPIHKDALEQYLAKDAVTIQNAILSDKAVEAQSEPQSEPEPALQSEPQPVAVTEATPVVVVAEATEATVVKHHGQLILDATVCPQDITYPTDLDLLNDAREKSEELIDIIYRFTENTEKPRTYRNNARKCYLKIAKKKHKTRREIRNGIRQQLGFLRRNIKNIHKLLDQVSRIPLDRHQYKYLLVIQTLYEQQATMYKRKKNSIQDRIVSIHQPHVRPIVRGKTNANVEFGAKIQVSLMNGFAFLEDLSWGAFNESTRLMTTVEKYKKRFGFYPVEILADKIYCTRDNRKRLKLLGIALYAKPLGRPPAVAAHVRPGERNPIEGKFGQAKTRYGMNRIKARLARTSESWIASIVLVLNLVKLAGQAFIALIEGFLTYLVPLFRRITGKELSQCMIASQRRLLLIPNVDDLFIKAS
jgi:transposase, IS5 family